MLWSNPNSAPFQARSIARPVWRACLLSPHLPAKTYWHGWRLVRFLTYFYHLSLICCERVLDQLLECQSVAAQHVTIFSPSYRKASVHSSQEAITTLFQLAPGRHGFRSED